MESNQRIENVCRIVVSNYKGVAISKDEYIVLTARLMGILSGLHENIREHPESLQPLILSNSNS
jgi:uncharacterized protein (DUF2252 family)